MFGKNKGRKQFKKLFSSSLLDFFLFFLLISFCEVCHSKPHIMLILHPLVPSHFSTIVLQQKKQTNSAPSARCFTEARRCTTSILSVFMFGTPYIIRPGWWMGVSAFPPTETPRMSPRSYRSSISCLRIRQNPPAYLVPTG